MRQHRIAIVAIFVTLTTAFSTAATTTAQPAVTDNVTFTTIDQSMWGPGGALAPTLPFRFTVLDLNVPPTSPLTPRTVSIPNPDRAAWEAALATCTLAFPRSVCISGGNVGPIHVPGLGEAPPATRSVKDGLGLTAEGRVRAGFEGSLMLDSGRVSVTYPTQVGLSAQPGPIRAGDVVRINTSASAGTPTMTTRFPSVDANLRGFMDLRAKVDLEAWRLGVGGAVNVLNVSTNGLQSQNLAGLRIGEGGITLRLLDSSSFFPVNEGLGTNISITPAGIVPEKLASLTPFIGFPVGDVQVFVPDLNTPPQTAVTTNRQIVNTTPPENRVGNRSPDAVLFGAGVSSVRTDIAKLDFDLDALSLFSGVPLGATAGVFLLASLEANVLDTDLGAFFGLTQKMTFTPQLIADLRFSESTLVEIAPGVFERVTHMRVPLGGDLRLVHPGGDLAIDPLYSLEGTFTNLSDFLIEPVLSGAFLQLKLSGLLPALLGINFDAAIAEQAFPLVGPFTVGHVGDGAPFALGGFESIDGRALHLLAADPASVPEPSTLFLLVSGVAGVAGIRRLTRRKVGCLSPQCPQAPGASGAV